MHGNTKNHNAAHGMRLMGLPMGEAACGGRCGCRACGPGDGIIPHDVCIRTGRIRSGTAAAAQPLPARHSPMYRRIERKSPRPASLILRDAVSMS